MSKKNYFLQILLIMLFITSCGGNKSIVKSEKSVIEYIFINDSIGCPNLPSERIKNEYLVVKHPNTSIENKINTKLLLIYSPYIEEKSYSQIIKDINSQLKNACLDNTLNEYNTIFRYESIFNKNEILGVLQRVGNYGYHYFYFEAINLDLTTGNKITSDKIFKAENMQELANVCNAKVQTTINELVTSAKENKDSNEAEYVESILDIFDKKHDYAFTLDDLNNFVFIETEDNLNGIKFIYTLDFPWSIKAHEPDFELFFTFKELKPFFKDDIQKRFNI